MKNVRKNFCTRFLAQLITLCSSRLLSWKDLRFLKQVSNKGSVPAWFNYLFNLIVIPNSPSFFILQQFRIPISHTVASISFIDISRNYWFNPQWAISFNRNTNSFLVGRVITTYPAPRNEALISHWIASSVDDLLSDFTACQGCASALPRSFTSKTLLKRCPSEKCFSYVPLSSLICYPTKPRTYIHADTRSVSLSASLGYAKSLLLFHLFAPDQLPSMNKQVPRISDIQLPSSVSTLYIDSSFLPPPSHPVSSMAFAWTAIDPDGFILESHYNNISSIFPSALRLEVFALLHGLDSLPQNSTITVATDCAQLLSLWSLYVDAPFIPRMLKESNHLLWSSIRTIILQKNLDVSLIKVPAHADNPLNNHVDALAKAAHTDSNLSSRPSSALLAPCILQFNSLPVDINIRKFIRDIFDAKSLLILAVLPRFNSYSSTSDIDWACTKFCLNNNKLFASHRNGRSEFCGFCIKLLLDMLLTLTTLQR
ncbi:ribonuclease H-like domain-containing protein [Rhizophagus irregularis DAOM 181602=DAOM 197198]|nr:ribonuclease H-like domain-containing protein [Rhizophagus irregularis DAOM 181602=DAOM 197198]